MSDWGWKDPFDDDEEARAREQRRAEREARRRGRRESLAERVAEAESAAAPPATAEAAEPRAAVATEPAPPAPPPQEPAAEPPTPAELAEPHRGAGGPPGRPPSAQSLWWRRAFGIAAVVVAVALVYLGGKAVKSEIGGADDPAPAPAANAPAKGSEFTIPEGLDRTQIADLVKEAGIKGDYVEATKSFKGFDPSKYGASDPASLEGFLFPATYDLPKKPTVDDLVERQLEAFKQNIAGVDLSYAKSKNLNVYDLLKIASMIEKEIQVPEERAKAAEVIYNRLSANNPLGIDATIRYEDHNYDQPLTESRLNEETPYNTRVVPGLPPTPIGNPGLASIEAAAKPDQGDLFYYVVKPGTCGEHVFTSSKAEFDQASDEYQAALEAEGGSPTDC